MGREISPGIYAGRAGTEILDSCSWERLSGASGESDIIAIDNPHGQFYVEVFDTDKYFRTSCVLTPLVEWPAPDKPFSKIEIGTYIVGREISPGIYAGRAGTEILDSCSWERAEWRVRRVFGHHRHRQPARAVLRRGLRYRQVFPDQLRPNSSRRMACAR